MADQLGHHLDSAGCFSVGVRLRSTLMSKAKEEEEEDFLRRVERALSVLTFHVPDTYWRKEAKELREELQEILLRR